MADQLRQPAAGPHAMWSTKHPPTRGQQQQIATLACELLGIPAPTSRYEAELVVARLRLGIDQLEPAQPVPAPDVEVTF